MRLILKGAGPVGQGLHHFCLKVDDVIEASDAIKEKGLEPAVRPHQGTQGKRALLIQADTTSGVQVELTGK